MERGPEDGADDAVEHFHDLVARVLIDKDGRLAISFSAPEDLAWSDLGSITIEFEDGSVQEVALEFSGSTSGPVTRGAAIRMVLTGLPENPASPAVAVHVDGPILLRLKLTK